MTERRTDLTERVKETGDLQNQDKGDRVERPHGRAQVVLDDEKW